MFRAAHLEDASCSWDAHGGCQAGVPDLLEISMTQKSGEREKSPGDSQEASL
jgi:hypothetical protein